MTMAEKMRALGYRGLAAEVSRFQRDYNKLFPAALLLTGRLDEATQAAVEVAYSSRVMFEAVRDGKSW